MDRKKVAVIDIGTGYTKCGYAGSHFPDFVFPTLVGKPVLKYDEKISDKKMKDVMVGNECIENFNNLQIKRPVSKGIIQNLEQIEIIFNHAFNDVMKINTEESRVLFSDTPLNSSKNREKIVEILFEKNKFSGLFLQNQAVLSLYAQGLLTGLVVDCGEGVTDIVPVVDGYVFPHLIKKVNYAGYHITTHLIDLLSKRGYSLNHVSDFEVIKKIKEKFCYMSYDYEREMQLAIETTFLMKEYTLPDGKKIKIETERFQAPEIFFNPEIVGIENDNLPRIIFKTIQEMDIDNRSSLYQHIVLCGGSSMFPGFSTRLEVELRELYLKKVLRGNRENLKKLRLKIEDSPQRKNLVFNGGAILADLMKDNDEFWVSKAEYSEEGIKCLKRRQLL